MTRRGGELPDSPPKILLYAGCLIEGNLGEAEGGIVYSLLYEVFFTSNFAFIV